MRTRAVCRRLSAFPVVALVLTSFAVAASAAQRTFVHSSPLGNDANAALSPPCTQAAPCRTFAVAIGATDPAGEIVALDTAGYGGVMITKSIKILAPGVYGGITVGGATGTTTGIVINAGDDDDITLRGLDINGLTTPPLPLIGIDIQNAGAVHIEKTTISGFAEDGGACIRVVTAKTARVYVDDSFLRHCVTGIYAAGTAAGPNRPGVVIDNTRIERGFASNPATGPIGLWVRGFMAVSLRNSLISRGDVAVQFDSDVSSGDNTLSVINSVLTNVNNGLLFSGSAAPVNTEIRIVGSQFTNMNTDALKLANSGVGNKVALTVSGTRIENLANAVTLANSASSALLMLYMDTSQAVNLFGGIDMNGTGGGQCHAHVRDSTLARVGTAIKTGGTAGSESVSLIRSQVSNCGIVLDHGSGVARLESNHINNCANGLVNNGSGNVESNGQNMIRGVANASGYTYITPTVVTLE